MRVVLDTSVIVAALRSNQGASRLLLHGALEGRFTLLLSVPLALEYESVLKRPEQLKVSGGTSRQIDVLIDAIVSIAVPVHRSILRSPLLRDPADTMVLETALSGRADLLVTFNRRDFSPISPAWGFKVVPPQQAVEQIWRSHEEE